MENCNCNGNLRIGRGNDFTIEVELRHPAMKTVEDFDLTTCTDIECAIVSRLGKHTAVDFTITDDGKLRADFDENVPLGVYGFEVKGKDAEGHDWRFYARPGEWLEIVNASSDENDPEPNGKSYYEKDVTFGIVTLAGDLVEEMKATMTAFTDAENERSEAETKRQEAESSREEQFNDAVKAAQAATDDANTAAGNADKATEAAQTATSDAQAATANAVKATEDASTATEEATAAAERANKAVDSVENKIKETLTISLSCNHDEKIAGKKVYVKKADDDTVLEELSWNGETLKTSLNPDVSYYVEAEAMEGYSTPKSEKYTAVSGNVRELSLAWQSEWFYPTIQMADGTDCDGNGVVMNYDFGDERVSMNYHKGTAIKVPFGKRYQMVVDTKDGYYAGIFQSRVAGEDEYRETVVYRPMSTNIGIQMTDGSIVAADDWDDTKYSADNVNGILLYTSTAKLVILCAEAESRVFGANGSVSGCDTQSDKNQIVGCKGEANTEALIAAGISTDDTTAAYHCHAVIFKSGRRGYLPAMDELTSICDNADAINACSQKVMGKDLFDYSLNYWSSTLSDAGTSWCWRSAFGAAPSGRSGRRRVLPVSAL